MIKKIIIFHLLFIFINAKNGNNTEKLEIQKNNDVENVSLSEQTNITIINTNEANNTETLDKNIVSNTQNGEATTTTISEKLKFNDYDDIVKYRNSLKKGKETVNCTIPNTVPNYFGECVCAIGFFGDSPVSARGCWKCDPLCHSQAECIFPGRCRCTGGLIGDGINECKSPEINYAEKAEIVQKAGYKAINIYFDAPFDYVPYHTYCKFYCDNDNIDEIYRGSINGNHSITCLIPKNRRINQVSISFDQEKWSNLIKFNEINDTNIVPPLPTNLPKAYNQKINIDSHSNHENDIISSTKIVINTGPLYLSIVSLLILFITNILTKRKKVPHKGQENDESAPFIKPTDKYLQHPQNVVMRKRETFV